MLTTLEKRFLCLVMALEEKGILKDGDLDRCEVKLDTVLDDIEEWVDKLT